MLLALMKKELLALSRDLHGLAALFLMPMLFIVIMSLALQNVYDPAPASLRYVVQDDEGSDVSEALTDQWARLHGQPQAAGSDWQAALRSGRLDYALVIDPGFRKDLLAMHPAGEPQVRLRLLAQPGIDAGAFAATRAELLVLATELRSQALLALVQGKAPAADGHAALPAQRVMSAERVSAGARPTSVQQSVPAWLVFGMFFVVASIAGLFVEERQCGALARLGTLGVSTRTLMASKAVPYLGINALQGALMLAVGVWLVPALGGQALSLHGVRWDALVLVLLAVSLAAIGLALALASVVRTHAQAMAVGPIVNIVFAAVGGVMVPKFVMPDSMQRIAELSPMNWGLEGMLSVLLRGGAVADVLPAVIRLGAFALVTFTAAALLLRRRDA
jgi:ABC-2 type transport system permease protein